MLRPVVILLWMMACGVQGFGPEESEGVYIGCTNRFEYRFEIKKHEFIDCEHLVEHYPMCAQNFTVSYENHPPYVYKNEKDGHIEGILPDMLQFALDSCCFGCNSIEYVGPFPHLSRFEQNVSMVIPVQTSTTSRSFFGHDYVHMVPIRSVSFFGPVVRHDPNIMAKTMAISVLSTWPLFVVSIAMAATSGICVWLLDSKYNSTEFPESYPRGPFEGFWWAFVSMTTVGYGDRSPKSAIARIFAVFWILIGITVISMYTASLSSSMTSSLIQSHEVTLYQKKVGILNTSTAGSIATLAENSKCMGYETLPEIRQAYHDGLIEAIALDENMANFYMEEFAEKGIELALYQRNKLTQSSYGMVAYNAKVSEFFRSFFESNDDQRDLMAMQTMQDHVHDPDVLVQRVPDENSFFSHDSPLFVYTLVTLLVISVVTTSIGILWKYMIISSKSCCANKGEQPANTMSQEELNKVYAREREDIIQLVNTLTEKMALLGRNPEVRV